MPKEVHRTKKKQNTLNFSEAIEVKNSKGMLYEMTFKEENTVE